MHFKPTHLLTTLALTAALTACGGGGGDPGSPPAPPIPSPGVDGPQWAGFASDARHTALGAVATQDLSRIEWQTPVDLAPQYTSSGDLLTHYGSPVVTTHNTVIVPVKTGASGGFRIEAHAGGNGVLIWSATTDYVLPAHNWTPSYNPALSAINTLYAPGAGGKLVVFFDADSATGSSQNQVFYGNNTYAAAPGTYDATVFINTPVTIDSQGNAFFGFIVTGTNPAGLVSGVARVGADGSGTWISASVAAGDATISKVAMNSAPALSPDRSTLYVAVNADASSGGMQGGYLLALDSNTLAVKSRAVLLDPSTNTPAWVSDDSTASPTVGPDGDVYFGVLETNFGTHNGRGWLLHFDAALASSLTVGAFGWDDTASIVPASMVPSYTGTSSYLLMTKYNNYGGVGSGDGLNRIAVLDPNASQADLDVPTSTVPVMKEVLTMLGPTPDPAYSGGVKEWCINTAAVDPLTSSVLVNSEDGYLYRWDLRSNLLTQRIQLTSGLGESYTPTAIGADGAVYAINNAVLFSIGQ